MSEPQASTSQAGLEDPIAVAQKAAKTKKVFVDPEVVRRRREEKALAKQRAAEAEQLNGKTRPPEPLAFLKRDFVAVKGPSKHSTTNGHLPGRRMTVMTWNLLAQALVRRTLFPGSDLLKWKDRGHILSQELLHYSPTVACLQEVDKLDHHEPVLRKAGYDLVWQKGYAPKMHGLCIAWKTERFSKAAEKLVKLDDATFDEGAGSSTTDGRPRTGCSRVTRNIGLLIALRFKDETEGRPKGIIFVTHHLFWHARHHYERKRQVAVLLREIDHFRRDHGDGSLQSWPCIFAGDFNIQPSEGTYRFMTGIDPTPAQNDAFMLSSVVHKTLDEHNFRLKQVALAHSNGEPAIASEEDDGAEDEDEDGKDAGGPSLTGETYAQPEGDEDRVLKNTRPARDSDGLLSLAEIRQVYDEHRHGMWSLYGQHYGSTEGAQGNVFGERSGSQDGAVDEETRLRRVAEGFYEPAWTNVTPLWRCTLDYIFCIPPAGTSNPYDVLEVKQLLPTHRLEDLEPGLPRKDKEPSDHVALIADIEI